MLSSPSSSPASPLAACTARPPRSRRCCCSAGSLGYLQHAHQLITDNALMAGMAIGIYGLARAAGFWLGTGAGIAFLSKGLLGPGLLGLTAVASSRCRAWRQGARGLWRCSLCCRGR